MHACINLRFRARTGWIAGVRVGDWKRWTSPSLLSRYEAKVIRVICNQGDNGQAERGFRIIP